MKLQQFDVFFFNWKKNEWEMVETPYIGKDKYDVIHVLCAKYHLNPDDEGTSFMVATHVA